MLFLSNSAKKPINLATFLIVGFLAVFLGVIAYLLWLPSVLILFSAFFFLPILSKWKKVGLIVGIIVFLFLEWSYLLKSFNFNPTSMISEEIPFLGLAYVIYILPFYKRIPKELFWFSMFLLGLGILKSKYMFLVVPFLLLGLLSKQLKEGIKLKREFMGIKEVPVLYCCAFLLVGLMLAGINLYPTQSDLKEMSYAINYAHDKNEPLYNTWGDGWMLESLGYDTNYKVSYPDPDWNKLTRPYLAWSLDDVLGCERISKRTQQCN